MWFAHGKTPFCWIVCAVFVVLRHRALEFEDVIRGDGNANLHLLRRLVAHCHATLRAESPRSNESGKYLEPSKASNASM